MSELILFEDEHLLAIDKPAGVNSHKPDRYAPDGIYEWLVAREPRWRNLAILHRLDKETSGVMLFGKTTVANRSLTQQFTARQVEKRYLLLTAIRPRRTKVVAQSPLAVTEFNLLQPHGEWFLLEAHPRTGKTHQIRLHATDSGFPILGDTLYNGAPAPRLMLHARATTFTHPVSGARIKLEASIPEAFETLDALVAAHELRARLLTDDTTAYRLLNGAADGFPGVAVDVYGPALLAQWQATLSSAARAALVDRLRQRLQPRWISEQSATRQGRTAPVALDAAAAESAALVATEHGVRYRIKLEAGGFSAGLFLDQRENRRRWLRQNLAGKTLLNCFAYTCSFSVVAARAGALTTSVDLARNYLEWGRENFQLNGLDDTAHEFVFGDVFEWLKRFAKRGRTWTAVILDPPTFSTTKQGRAFRAERDYAELVRLAAPLTAPGGVLFCSTNQRTFAAERFEREVVGAVTASGRRVATAEFATQPVDFRLAPRETAYLKTLWLTLAD